MANFNSCTKLSATHSSTATQIIGRILERPSHKDDKRIRIFKVLNQSVKIRVRNHLNNSCKSYRFDRNIVLSCTVAVDIFYIIGITLMSYFSCFEVYLFFSEYDLRVILMILDPTVG